MIVDAEAFADAAAVLAAHLRPNSANEPTPDFSSFIAEESSVGVGVQLVVRGSEWDTFVTWRDLLRAGPGIRSGYDEVKRRFDGGSMDEYREATWKFIESALAANKARTASSSDEDLDALVERFARGAIPRSE